jgi:16S rRNA pseudouridine516 synthase
MARSPLIKYLANLGYGSRREVERLLQLGRVTHADGARVTGEMAVSHDVLRVDGEPLDPPPGSLIALHKPVGFVCSTTDAANQVIYDLLPPRFRERAPIIAPVGRLDVDTSGLLLLTDDGTLNHRLTSPRHHVPKRYLATVSDALRGDEGPLFTGGALRLSGDEEPAIAADFLPLSSHAARVTLFEGRYHQVRRMFAAAGHHVVALERESIGDLTLGVGPLDALGVGEWRLLTSEDRARVDR